MEAAKWDVKNHGGNPTTNESKKYAIFVGRFQPYHQGHISLVMQKINKGIPLLFDAPTTYNLILLSLIFANALTSIPKFFWGEIDETAKIYLSFFILELVPKDSLTAL